MRKTTLQVLLGYLWTLLCQESTVLLQYTVRFLSTFKGYRARSQNFWVENVFLCDIKEEVEKGRKQFIAKHTGRILKNSRGLISKKSLRSRIDIV